MTAQVVRALRALAGSLWFRTAVTLALLAVVLVPIDWSTIADRVRTGSPVYGLLAVLSVGSALVVGAVRWRLLLRIAQVDLPTRELARIYAATSFANAFLPTSVGGDIARPLMVSRRGPTLVRAITTVLIERVVALVALLGLALIGLVLAPDVVSTNARGALAAATGAFSIAVLVLLVRPSYIGRLARAALPARFATSVEQMAFVTRRFLGSPGRALVVILQSVAFQALVTMQIVLLAKMIGVDLPFGLAAVALALVTLAMLVPISIGGFGVREGSYAVILSGAGISHTDAVLISLLSVVALFLATLPGALELVRAGFRPADLEGSQP